jgi:phytoene synthase
MTSTAVPGELERAYRRCQEITRTEAKNFAYGIRLLPPPKRRALSAVYALARRIDDVGDGPGEPAEKVSRLEELRAALHRPAAPDDLVMTAIHDVKANYSLPMEGFEQLIDGCRRDVEGGGYQTFEELVGYCRLVAGSIGRLSLAVFGTPDPAVTDPLADDLGTALQLTNILRDVREDREELGRIYLPTEDIERFGVQADLRGPVDAFARLARFEAERAEEYFGRGLQLLGMLDHRSRACVGAMAGIYRRLLGLIERDPAAVLERRVSVPTAGKLWVAVAALAGRA